jgi:RNA polymerase primary sigma factor
MAERLGRTPSHDEVGQALRLSKKKMGIVAKAIRVNNLTPQSENLEDDGPGLDDVLTDDRNKGAEIQLIEADDLDRVFVHLGTLEDREATVIRMRFGLGCYKPMTLREVGEKLGLTRERVRQLESQSLQKLMHALAETSGQIGN